MSFDSNHAQTHTASVTNVAKWKVENAKWQKSRVKTVRSTTEYLLLSPTVVVIFAGFIAL